jgi:hypothetical protein
MKANRGAAEEEPVTIHTLNFSSACIGAWLATVSALRTAPVAEMNDAAHPSVGTSKPANDGHLKTGQRTERRDEVLYSFIGK